MPLVAMYETTGGAVSFTLPTGDELGCPPMIRRVTVLDGPISAARLAALPDETIIDLIGGKTSEAMAFSVRAHNREVEGSVALTEQSVRFKTAARDLDALRTPIEISGYPLVRFPRLTLYHSPLGRFLGYLNIEIMRPSSSQLRAEGRPVLQKMARPGAPGEALCSDQVRRRMESKTDRGRSVLLPIRVTEAVQGRGRARLSTRATKLGVHPPRRTPRYRSRPVCGHTGPTLTSALGELFGLSAF